MEIPARMTIMEEKPVALQAWLMAAGKEHFELRSPRSLTLRALIKLEAEDSLWMGEVLGCRADGQSWIATVSTEHVLRGVAELTRLAERFIHGPVGELIPR